MSSEPETPAGQGATQPIRRPPQPGVEAESGLQPPPTAARGLWRRVRWFLLLLVAALTLGSTAGYVSGRDRQQAAQQEEAARLAQEQFDLALDDLNAGRFEVARQRLEYVIQLEPSFPGAPEKLAQALLALNEPTATAAPLATPTPNLAPVEELFDQALAAFAAHDWTATVDVLLAMRAKDPGFRAVEADGLLYAALRNRGVHRIANEGQLEEGMYDLALAERFGPIDRDADNWRSWAQLYLQANSYIGVNWAQAAFYFAQVYLVAPYLKNDTYLKYATAANKYGDELVAGDDPCAALEQYEQSLLAWENGTLVPTATEAAKLCLTATSPPPAPPKPSATETPAESPTPAPTEERTPTFTPEGG